MANLYVTSAETFSGKSAICIGLGLHFREDGLKVGYMKPVNVNCPKCGSPKRSHHVCAQCGFYAGEQRVDATEV